MKYLLFMLLLLACSREPAKSEQPLDLLQKRDKYVARLADLQWGPRCDMLTQKALVSAMLSEPLDLTEFEWNPGEWHRDCQTCWPDESKSEISKDSMIMLLHNWLSHKDQENFSELMTYLQAHTWIAGPGDTSATDTTTLRPVFSKMAGVLKATEIESRLAGFQGHLLAMVIWLDARLSGGVTCYERWLLRQLVHSNPENPLYNALLGRYTDGNFIKAKEVLGNLTLFPEDKLPEGIGSFGWGSIPDLAVYLATVKLISERE